MSGRGRGRGQSFGDDRGRRPDHGGGGGGGGGSFQNRPGQGFTGSSVFSSPRGVPTPDSTVTEIENKLLGSTTAGLAGLTLTESFPTRPSYGSKGTGLVLWANYFNLKASNDLVLYQYSVSVTPEAVGKKLGQIVRLFLKSPELQDLQSDIVTDFRSILIARQKLPIPSEDTKVPYRAEGEDEPRENATTYTVKLDLNKTLSVADLMKYLTSKDLNSLYEGKLQIVQALNILVNHHAKLSNKIVNVGASKSFSLVDAEAQDLEAGLRAIRGFFTSVRAATGRMLLNVNISNTAFYQAVPLDQLIRVFFQSNNRSRGALAQFLKGIRITTNHLKAKKNRSGETIIRAKTIRGLAVPNDGHTSAHPPRVKEFGAGPKDVKFWLEQPAQTAKPSPTPKKKPGKSGPAEDSYISVYDYFKDTYNIQVNDSSVPVINVGTQGNPSYLPAQVCVVLSGQHAKKKLSPGQTTKMISFAVRSPAANAKSIVSKGLHTIGVPNDAFPQLNKFGVAVTSELITVQGRVLAEPSLMYGDKQQVRVMGGSWSMVPRPNLKLKFSSPKVLQKWSCLHIRMEQGPGDPEVAGLLEKFRNILKSMGIAAPEPLRARWCVRPDMSKLEEVFKSAVAFAVPLILVILPAGNMREYNMVKQLADVRYGIHTICAIESKITKVQGQDQYLRNLALKVNLKLGGDNQVVQAPSLGLITEEKTMVVGIDVTHPSPGSSSQAPSVSAMVASVNAKLGQWPGILGLQEASRQEMVSNLGAMLKTRLKMWCQQGRHKEYPENILVYRDGVSEGQYSTVLERELPQLRAACREVYPAPDQQKGLPHITLIVVGKRHNTRFYVTKESDADRSGNSKAGTVVDRGVTEARSWDFFLQSHAAIKGTARPAHYFVLLDEIFRQRYAKTPGKNVADELQMVTQAMCYVFGRATKAVSYCTPAYHADILCERARCYLSHVFEPDSTDSVAPSTAGNNGPTQADLNDWANRIAVHPRLHDTMFYV